jgi:hypothetical protein
MSSFIRTFSVIAITALCATHAVAAKTHHRGSRATTPAATRSDAQIPVETKRDPADIALDCKIKGICNGC